jgi:hypothetical protein
VGCQASALALARVQVQVQVQVRLQVRLSGQCWSSLLRASLGRVRCQLQAGALPSLPLDSPDEPPSLFPRAR